jgi:hypothetical protein
VYKIKLKKKISVSNEITPNPPIINDSTLSKGEIDSLTGASYSFAIVASGIPTQQSSNT